MASFPRVLLCQCLHVANDTDVPLLVSGGEHICHARQINPISAAVDPDVCSSRARLCSHNTSYSTEVPFYPDACLTKIMSDRFNELHSDFNDAFDIRSSLYNTARGKIQAFVDMIPILLPQRILSVQQKYPKRSSSQVQ